jgi:hypothetical protein
MYSSDIVGSIPIVGGFIFASFFYLSILLCSGMDLEHSLGVFEGCRTIARFLQYPQAAVRRHVPLS